MKAELLLNCRSYGGHSFWDTSRGIAVADDSIRKWGSPGSTDDGWLFVDEEKLHGSEEYFQVVGAAVDILCGRCNQLIPVRDINGKSSVVLANSTEFKALCRLIHERRKLVGAA